MPRNPDKKHCAIPNCRAYAMRGRQRCRPHLHTALPPPAAATPPAESGQLGQSFYSRHYTLQEIADLLDQADDPGLDQEITAARIAIRRILAYIDKNDQLPDRDLQAALALVFTGASTIGRLLRHQQVLSGEAADSIAGGFGAIIDQITADLEMRQ